MPTCPTWIPIFDKISTSPRSIWVSWKSFWVYQTRLPNGWFFKMFTTKEKLLKRSFKAWRSPDSVQDVMENVYKNCIFQKRHPTLNSRWPCLQRCPINVKYLFRWAWESIWVAKIYIGIFERPSKYSKYLRKIAQCSLHSQSKLKNSNIVRFLQNNVKHPLNM